PKLGGLGIFFGFLFGYMIFGVNTIQMNSVLIGSFIIIITGIVDDIKPITAFQKLVGQVAAALTIIFYGNIILSHATIFGYDFQFGILAYPITLLFILGCVNIINLIDGLDGLSSGISSIYFITIGIISYFQGKLNSLPVIIGFIMLGATLGFLLHNFSPAKLFAGDSGSMFMGFIISVVALLGFKGTMLTSLIVPILILAIPILDTFFAIIRRLLKKQPIFKADKEHMHHQFLKMNFTPRATVLIVYVINILFSLASIFYVLKDPVKGSIIYVSLFLLVVFFVLNTSIISEKVSEKVKNIERKGFKKKSK
ncbi:MAG: undecaprenyl/decaprenyl-phosphate alpha-N-acetylglucosaminyl 1-phosphate transferase, partial [Bacilli bacterium]|nr:undecaprenyl/decaprenyl-phosphate alpha-N-acetylglucosaminyl 1-phosphate transferase [Bacilli bacterium]